MKLLTCPNCDSVLKVKDDFAGKKVKCPRCAAAVAVKAATDPPETVSMPAPSGSEAALGTIDGSAATKDQHQQVAVPGYEILSELGRGGMGVVYKARHIGLDRTVALKMVLSGARASGAELARFRVEAEAVARLQHPSIVQIHETGVHQGLPFFSLEFVEGGSLDRKLGGAPLPASPAAQLTALLARAMHAAHEKNILHRDLKPANVFLMPTKDKSGVLIEDRQGIKGRYLPKIGDFGLAKKLDDDHGQTQTGSVMGTPSFMAPEQAAGKGKESSPAADTYALGAILYDLLTGRPPFRAATPLETLVQVVNEEPVPPSRLNPLTPRDLETICFKCLQKDPKKRYATAQELAEDLERFLADEPIRARPVGRIERGLRWCRRNRALAGAIAAAVVILVLGSVVSVFFGISAINIAEAEKSARATADERTKYANEQTRIAKQERDDKEEEARLKEIQRKKAVEATDEALKATRARDGEIVKVRNALLTAQLLRINEIWQRDPAEALRMLDDEDSCPAEVRDFTWKLMRQLVPRERSAWQEGQQISGLACSPGGKLLATWGPAGIRIREAESGRLVAAIKEPAERVVFDRAGSALVSCKAGRISIWRSNDGKLIQQFDAHKDRIRSLAFNGIGFLLASSSLDGTVKLWQTTPVFSLRDTFPGHKGEEGCVGFGRTADGKSETLIVVDQRLNITSHNLATRESSSRGADSADLTWQSVLSPDGKYLAISVTNIAGGGREVDVLELFPDPQSPKNIRSFRHETYLGHLHTVKLLAFSADGKWLASADDGGIVKIWDVKKDREFATFAGAQPVTGLSFQTGPIINWLATAGGKNNSVQLWHMRPKGARVLQSKFFSWYFALAVSPDGKYLAAGGSHPKNEEPAGFQCWERATGKLVARHLRHFGQVYSVAFSPDGKILASAGGEGTIVLTELDTGKIRATCSDGKGEVSSVAFNKDGTMLASGHADSMVRLWDLTKQQPTPTVLAGHSQAVFSVAFHPEGKTVASGGGDGTVRLWDVAEGRQRHMVAGHAKAVRAVCFNKDGALLASGGLDNAIKFWDGGDLTLRRTLLGHRGDVLALAFSPDGKTLASGGGDNINNELRLWDVVNGRPRATLKGPRYAIHALAFFPDGEALATSGYDPGVVYLWETAGHQPAAPPFLVRPEKVLADLQASRWQEAAADYAVVGDGDDHFWFEHACTRLLVEDNAGYAKARTTVLTMCENGLARPFLAARTCTLAPAPAAEVEKALKLAASELANNRNAFWSKTQLAALHVRAGRHDQAEPLLRKCLTDHARWQGNVVPRLWLVLTLKGQDKTDEARKELATVKGIMDKWGKQMPTGYTGGDPLHVHDWLEANILRREAEKLLAEKGPG